MNERLALRLHVAAPRITIFAQGRLDAATAHLLCKVVVATLRRHPASTLEIDLTRVDSVDEIGEIALEDCAYEAARRGILFTVTKPRPRRAKWFRTITHTGAICRKDLSR